MQLNKRERRLLLFALIIILPLLLGRYLILPYRQKGTALQEKLVQTRQQLTINSLIARDFQKYQRLLADKKAELADLSANFYRGEAGQVRLEVIKQLDRELKKNALAVKSKELELIERGEGDLTRIRYQAELEGELRAVLNFLTELNQYQKYYRVQQLEIKGGDNYSRLAVLIIIEVISIEGDNDV